MEHIIEPSIDFDFSKLYLASPSSLTGGAYFTRIFLNNKPLYIQTPKSLTKQGFIKSGKKIYVDLMFDNTDTILINWLENLETRCQELIYEKSEKWFDSMLEKSDIESAFTSPIKIFKSGKFYLMRTNVKQNIKIYNEVDEIISMDDIKPEMNLLSILEIQGIKFTSRNFQIEIELKQSMVVSPDPFLDECFIKKPSITRNSHVKSIIHNEKEKEKEKESNLILFSTLGNITKDNFKQNTEIKSKEELEKLKELKELKENDKFEDVGKLENVSQVFKESLSNINEMNINEMNINEMNINEMNSNEIEITDSTNLNEVVINSKTNEHELTEFNIETPLDSNIMTLKKPNQVYYDIYKVAREKAKQAKKEAILAFLEAKNIKKTYMLDDIDDSDDDENEYEENENDENEYDYDDSENEQ